MKRFDIYETVTNLIVERLEAGVIPWQMPFKSANGLPLQNPEQNGHPFLLKTDKVS